ncbi:MAG: hypothetical protein G01um101431_203 [Parcubacteria group bacterium Gr01-1014_31]|nr:MAG: hypothetical protein G01um101431_203 [Parcubacteria group bacterium Gr01-1014_31]
MSTADGPPSGLPDPVPVHPQRELDDARSQLATVRKLLIDKLAESKSSWWKRRRALQELAEQLAELLHLTDEELRIAAPAPDERGPSLMGKTAQIIRSSATLEYWKRRRKKGPE